jgi:hypothetical protein
LLSGIGRLIGATGKIDLPADKVGMLYGIAHRWINIVSLAQALILHLEGQPFAKPEVMPVSPIAGFEDAY